MIRQQEKSNLRSNPTSLEVPLERRNFAYSDPCSVSPKTQLNNVTFERIDYQTLSSQATKLFNSKLIFEHESEREWLINNVKSTKIMIQVDEDSYKINGSYVLNESQQFILTLHGFGASANWANWSKMFQPLNLSGSYSVISVDLPGFGRSSGRDLNQTSWKKHGPEIVAAILSSFHIKTPVDILANCGGAATTVRTINRYPAWFRNRTLIFRNSVIGDFGESKPGDFETTLKTFNIHIVVHWFPDKDHTHQCVAYKRWNKLRQSRFSHLQLVDFDPKTQTSLGTYPEVRVANISRCESKNMASVYKPNDEYVQGIISTLSNNRT